MKFDFCVCILNLCLCVCVSNAVRLSPCFLYMEEIEGVLHLSLLKSRKYSFLFFIENIEIPFI